MRNPCPKIEETRGSTLIETLAAIAIIGVLVAGTVTVGAHLIRRAEEERAERRYLSAVVSLVDEHIFGIPDREDNQSGPAVPGPGAPMERRTNRLWNPYETEEPEDSAFLDPILLSLADPYALVSVTGGELVFSSPDGDATDRFTPVSNADGAIPAAAPVFTGSTAE